MIKMKLDTLLDIPLASVYGLVNEQDKKIYLTYSNETILSIARNTKSLKEGSHSCRELVSDIEKLEIVILETITERLNIKPRYEYWIDHYRNMGYTLYREYRSVSYKVKVSALDYNTVGVYLVNKRNDKTLVGRFATVDEAHTWSSSVYNTDKVYEIVMHESMMYYNKRKGKK